ncbi:MAG: hypothetical protein DRJ55_04875 [Thermoprotei archaeon]|nr:MAG: hypothetical protein DRJ55_04875 [Thermoprotei archaeon]
MGIVLVMESLAREVRAVRVMLEYVIEHIVGVEEPEDWEKELIERALREEALDEEEIWRALGLK